MKVSSILSVAALATGALSVPLSKRQALNDLDILNFALTLEHLENNFYKQSLSTLGQAAFKAVNFTDAYYLNVKQIAYDEQTHVDALTAAIKAAGGNPVAACTYDFGKIDINSFLALSNILEGVGTSAYLGAAPAVNSKAVLATAGSILAVEALHTSLQRTTLGYRVAGNPFYAPIVPNGAYTLAAAFIKSCPSTNPTLPFKAFPKLTITNPMFPPVGTGAVLQFSTPTAMPAGAFVTFVSGLSVVSVKPTGSGTTFSAAVPAMLGGQSYVFVTSSNVTTISDAAVLFGPAVVELMAPVSS